jgi:hypothetical protein
VVVSLRPKPHFISLGDFIESVAYLGCLVDVDKSVVEWLELRVQFVSELGASALRQHHLLDNGSLDRRWEDAVARRKASHPGMAIATPLETRPSAPVLIEKQSLKSIPLAEASPLGRWGLCTDDTILKAAGLGLYRGSLERFLMEQDTSTPRLLPLTPDADGQPAPPLADKLTGQSEAHLTFNPQAGRLMVLRLCPISLVELCDLLSGQTWEGIADGEARFDLDPAHVALCDWDSLKRREGFLFNSALDRHGRMAEVLHLKIGLLFQALQQVRKATERTQMPLLNLSHESFRVRFGNMSSALPFLWTAECCLIKEGFAQRKTLETTLDCYFIRMDDSAPPIYHPEGFQFQQDSRGDFKCRNVLPVAGGTIIEGTLSIQQSLPVSPHDLVWLRVPLGNARVELFGHIDATRGTRGEMAFRSVPQRIAAGDAELIRQHFKFPGCSYEIIPQLSSPFDLYSMAVLSIRCLLMGRHQSFNVAVDNIMTLARGAADSYSPQIPHAERIRQLLTDDLLHSLGPHVLGAEESAPQEATALVSLELWCDLLSWIAAMLPGYGPDSFCSGLGDAPPTGLETVFDEPLKRLESLWLRTRRLIVTDGGMNVEIQKIIDGMTAVEETP